MQTASDRRAQGLGGQLLSEFPAAWTVALYDATVGLNLRQSTPVPDSNTEHSRVQCCRTLHTMEQVVQVSFGKPSDAIEPNAFSALECWRVLGSVDNRSRAFRSGPF